MYSNQMITNECLRMASVIESERQMCRAARHRTDIPAPYGPPGPAGFLNPLLDLEPRRICLAWPAGPVSAIAVAQRQTLQGGTGLQPAVRYAPDDPELAQAGLCPTCRQQLNEMSQDPNPAVSDRAIARWLMAYHAARGEASRRWQTFNPETDPDASELMPNIPGIRRLLLRHREQVARQTTAMTADQTASLRLLPATAERWSSKPDDIAVTVVSSRPAVRIAAAALLYQDGTQTIIAIRPEPGPEGAAYRHRVTAASHNAGALLLDRQAADVARHAGR